MDPATFAAGMYLLGQITLYPVPDGDPARAAYSAILDNVGLPDDFGDRGCVEVKTAERLPDGTIWATCSPNPNNVSFRIFRISKSRETRADRKIYAVRCASALPANICGPWKAAQ